MIDSFGARSTLRVGPTSFEIARLDALDSIADVHRLPFSLKVLLENLLRHEDGTTVSHGDVEALARWTPAAVGTREIAFVPARVLMQDFTGVPAIVDLAAMRDALEALGGDPAKITPQVPVELIVDHFTETGKQQTLTRSSRRVSSQRRVRVHSKPGAIRAAPVGAGRVRQCSRHAS